MSRETESQTADASDVASAPATAHYLVRAFETRRLAAPPERIALARSETLVLGGDTARASRREANRRVEGIPDAWMSRQHAEIRQAFGRWTIVDLGAKNRTRLNGAEIGEAPLHDGDVIQTGKTIWLYREVEHLGPVEDRVAGTAPFDTLHAPLEHQLASLAGVFATALPLLVRGASGSGKDVLARAVHAATRPTAPFIAINCGALPPSLVEPTLFGQRRGAFTGATEERLGVIRSAAGGTLFLDEIAELSPQAQAGLLRALETGEVIPVGDAKPVRVDFRLISATHRDLADACARGAFRADLLARLRGVELELPPLAERREDVAVIAHHVIASRAGSLVLAPEAAHRLLVYPWPLNARELRHALERALACTVDDTIAVSSLPPEVAAVDLAVPVLDPELAALRDTLADAMARHAGNVSAVARELGKDRKQVYRWLRRARLVRDGS